MEYDLKDADTVQVTVDGVMLVQRKFTLVIFMLWEKGYIIHQCKMPNVGTQASRKSSPRVNNEAVQKAAAALNGSDHRRATNVSARLDAQQKKLNIPILPTTTIGSFPQIIELRRVLQECKAKKIFEKDYASAIKEEISKVVKL
ncbi:hypothetical protein AgCh_015626 [Apium graveolens]